MAHIILMIRDADGGSSVTIYPDRKTAQQALFKHVRDRWILRDLVAPQDPELAIWHYFRSNQSARYIIAEVCETVALGPIEGVPPGEFRGGV